MKKKLIANWKMNMTLREAQSFLADMPGVSDCFVAIAPPYTLLSSIGELARRLGIKIGAQNMHESSHGAFTGEISSTMLKDVGCQFVILGHSERRHLFSETDERIARKVERAIVEDMPIVLCVGETEEERDLKETEEVLERQLKSALEVLTPNQISDVTVAYEPVWAIGTGKVASLEQIESAHKAIRGYLAKMFGQKVAEETYILYGGSVQPDNFEEILSLDDVDGALVGSASLKAASFNQLIDLLRG